LELDCWRLPICTVSLRCGRQAFGVPGVADAVEDEARRKGRLPEPRLPSAPAAIAERFTP
jgi:hypothetical protein